MSKTHRLLLTQPKGSPRYEMLKNNLETDWEIETWSKDDGEDAFRERIATVEVLVGGGVPDLPQGIPLKLFQIPFTGFDWTGPEKIPAGTVVCNTFEHETTIAEHVLAGMLEFQTGLMRETHPVMKEKSFNGRDISKGPMHREMRGATVGIVGYGHIGREVAKRCKAFDMRVMALSRTKRDEPGVVDWYGTLDDMDTLLAESDFVIVTAPLNDDTRSMIDSEAFGKMKSDAVICNVGRGAVVDEAALYEALSGKQIRGGIIDVWYTYPSKKDPNPWPSKFPFQKLDNIIMSPHNSAWSNEMANRRWAFVAANLDRFARGEELQNFCFEGTRQG